VSQSPPPSAYVAGVRTTRFATADGWHGHRAGQQDWSRLWPQVVAGIDAWPALKQDGEARVAVGTLDTDGASSRVVVKRPRRADGWKKWLAFARRDRAARAWWRTHRAAVAGLPTERPMAYAKRGTTSLGVYGFVEGVTLFDVADLKVWRAAGRVLGEVERAGFEHADAKPWNFLVGPTGVVMVDGDALHRRPIVRRSRRGLRRLLRDTPTPDHAAAVRAGFSEATGSAG
jgi:hypothetical protein